MAIQGHESTLPVTVDDMAYHTAAVRRGNSHAFIMTDLPFMSYATLNDALQSAKKVMQAGAQMIKIEGGAWLSESVRVLTQNGIPVCVHLGLTPQSVHVFGGYKLQARTREAADQLIADCTAVVDAGAAILLLPNIPVIGIGAGHQTDGQVLVVQDMLGLTFGRVARFVRNFMKEQSGETAIVDAFKAYHAAVQDQSFPAPEHTFQVEL